MLHVGEEVNCVGEMFGHHVRSKCEIGRTYSKFGRVDTWSDNVRWPFWLFICKHYWIVTYPAYEGFVLFDRETSTLWNHLSINIPWKNVEVWETSIVSKPVFSQGCTINTCLGSAPFWSGLTIWSLYLLTPEMKGHFSMIVMIVLWRLLVPCP